jgi:hypothetical protein
VGHFVEELLGDGGEFGEDDPDVCTGGLERLGQGAAHVAQSARLDKGNRFKGGE